MKLVSHAWLRYYVITRNIYQKQPLATRPRKERQYFADYLVSLFCVAPGRLPNLLFL